MSKASPESISEFIKYATPRLEYLAGMEPGQMEKDAGFIAKAIASGAKLSAKNMARLERIARARNVSVDQLLKRNVIGNRSINRTVNTANGPITRKAVLDPATRDAALANRFQAINSSTLAPYTRGGSTALVPYQGAATQGSQGMGKTLQGYLDKIRGGIQKNPLAFTAGAGFAGTALGDQLGYGRGNAAGREHGADIASQYYNTLINQYKQNYNNDTSGILSRIGNVFSPTKADSIFSLPQ